MCETYECLYCSAKLDWNSADEQKGVIWSCENCGSYFCEACFKERHGFEALESMVSAESEGLILCPDCYSKDRTGKPDN